MAAHPPARPSPVLRYARLLAVQLRASLLLTLQYRLDFFVEAVMSVFWTAAAVVPLLVLYGQRETIAGWTWPEALLVVAYFTMLKGVLDGAIQPCLQTVVEYVRKGTLDFVLLKPADAQFLVSTARIMPWKATDLLGGLGLLAYGLHALGRAPSLCGVAATLGLLAASTLLLYSFLILVVSGAFFFVKVDNLTWLFLSVFDAARWPSSVFKGVLAFLFTFVIPLAVMTTFPALATLDKLPGSRAVGALAAALAFAGVARLVWTRAIARYTSAGG